MGNVVDRGLASRARTVLVDQTALLFLVLVAMVVVFTVINPIFFSSAVFANILQDWGPIVLMATAQTLVIVSGGIDLSVGAALGLSGVVSALAMRELTASGQSAWSAMLLGVLVAGAVGLAVGLVNGVLINRVKLVPFIATLCTMGAALGLSLVLTGGTPVAGGPAGSIQFSSKTYLGMFTVPIIVVTVIVVAAGLYLHKTRFGRWTYAIGSNQFAARGAGINVESHLYKIYALSGLLSGLAGMFVYLRLGSGSASSGVGQELSAIAAAVIGGTSLLGGVGRLAGTVIGAFIITGVLSGLIIIGVQANWQRVVIAALIAVAVGAQGLSNGSLRAK
jgi:ribose transport system permease protein